MFGQEPPATQKASQEGGNPATQASATPPAPVGPPPASPPDAAKPQDTPPATTAATPAPQPAASQPKGKGSDKRSKGGPVQAGNTPAYTGVDNKPYEIGPEDVLYLNVLHQLDVTGQITVRPDGFVTVRYAGEIKAAGLTTQQLTDMVTEKLTQYFNHPEVNIQVVSVRSKKYYVSGEVKKPGSYGLATPKTILEALIDAGGPADFAKTKKIYILRKTQKIPFNYNDVSKGKHLEQNILLQNGDVVVVP